MSTVASGERNVTLSSSPFADAGCAPEDAERFPPAECAQSSQAEAGRRRALQELCAAEAAVVDVVDDVVLVHTFSFRA